MLDKAIKAAPLLVKVLEQLDNMRKAAISFENGTDYTLHLNKSHHWSGRFEIPPDTPIPSKHVSVFGSQKRDYAIATGTVGFVLFQCKEANIDIAISWSNPFLGTYKATGAVKSYNYFNNKSWDDIYDEVWKTYTESTDTISYQKYYLTYSAGEKMKFVLRKEG